MKKELVKVENNVNLSSYPTYKISKREKRRLERLNKKAKKYQDDINFSLKEEKIIKKQNYKFWKNLLVIVIIIVAFLLIGCLTSVFLFVKGFFNDSFYGNLCGGIVLGVLLGILGIFVIRPIIIGLSKPSFTLDAFNENQRRVASKKNFKKLQKVATNIIETNDNVSTESKNLLKTFYHNKKELNNVLKKIYHDEISKDIQKVINDEACKVLLSTALSQNSRFDSLSVFFINVRMIMLICVRCGYHPTYARLSKLIVKVFRNALIAYSFQSLKLEDLIVNGIDKLTNGILSIIPFVKDISKSLIQGSSNALLTLRIGIITKKYLFEEFTIQQSIKDPDEVEVELVECAIKEANNNIDSVIDQCKKSIGKKEKVSVK
ncbi:MAG: DUF697 domain-containing protein [Bacillales bacterium]|nr:DUF697 domain-containing protein [Bacillales bacterium]